MIAIDERAVPVAWNAAALRILGVPSEGADEKALRFALDRHPELAIGWSAGSSHPSRSVELAVGGGESVPIQLTEVPFEPRPGASGTLVLLRDLATLRKVEAHLFEAGRFAVLAHLAGSLAHEIRNPLHSIGLNAGVVRAVRGSAGDEPGGQGDDRFAANDSRRNATIDRPSEQLPGVAPLGSGTGARRRARGVPPRDPAALVRRDEGARQHQVRASPRLAPGLRRARSLAAGRARTSCSTRFRRCRRAGASSCKPPRPTGWSA